MMNDQVRQLSHGLRLFGVHQSFEKRAQQAGSESLNHLEFLRLILEDEFNQRKNAAAKRLLTKAKFRSTADLEDWDQTFDRGFTKTKLRELAAIGFYQNQENLLLLGKTGAGKTHLAIAIGRRLCAENISTLFFPVNFLFEEVNLQYGGTSTLGGSGAVSGVLQLNNKSDFNSGIHVYKGISANTFSTYGEQFSISIGLKNYYSVLKFYQGQYHYPSF